MVLSLYSVEWSKIIFADHNDLKDIDNPAFHFLNYFLFMIMKCEYLKNNWSFSVGFNKLLL